MTANQLGALTEARFSFEALSRGLVPNWAQIDTVGYDLVIENQGKMARVQVKGTTPHFAADAPNAPRYQVNLSSSKLCSASGRWDILAVFLNDLEEWYFYTRSQIPRTKGMFTIHRTGNWKDLAQGWEVFDA
jgi:hypothetical protein